MVNLIAKCDRQSIPVADNQVGFNRWAGWHQAGHLPDGGELGRLGVSEGRVCQSLKLPNWQKSELAYPITDRQLRGRRPSLVPLTSYVPRLNKSGPSIRLQQSCGATLIAEEAMRYILMELSTTSWPESSVEVARDVWLWKRRRERLRNCFSGWIREALRIDSSLGILFGVFLGLINFFDQRERPELLWPPCSARWWEYVGAMGK